MQPRIWITYVYTAKIRGITNTFNAGRKRETRARKKANGRHYSVFRRGCVCYEEVSLTLLGRKERNACRDWRRKYSIAEMLPINRERMLPLDDKLCNFPPSKPIHWKPSGEKTVKVACMTKWPSPLLIHVQLARPKLFPLINNCFSVSLSVWTVRHARKYVLWEETIRITVSFILCPLP